MSNGTYSGTYSSIALSASYPTVTLAPGATVDASSGDALVGGTLGAYAIFNDGAISATGTNSRGISLQDGGSVTNGAGALIEGFSAGILVSGGAGTVFNDGTIESTTYGYAGVWLTSGGAVTNNASGLIEGRGSGIDLIAAGTIDNAGTIKTSVLSFPLGYGFPSMYDALSLEAGGSVLNTGAAALIQGIGGIYATGAATIQNGGMIIGITDDGIRLDSGTVTNSGKAALIEGGYRGVEFKTGTGTVTNTGTIEAIGGTQVHESHRGPVTSTLQGAGVGLYAGGIVWNSDPAALITGGVGVVVSNAPGYVINYGTIDGTFAGVAFYGSVTGDVTNGDDEVFSVITGGSFGVLGAAADLLIDNFATIVGSSTAGISIESGSVHNEYFGLIEGKVGVEFAPDSMVGSTVFNEGEIESTAGTAGVAVQFGNGNDLLIIEPYSGFYGKVEGGGGSNTLELKGGPDAAYMDGLGTEFVQFNSIVVDPGLGLGWQFVETNTIASGATLTDEGFVHASGTLLNDGVIQISGGLLFDETSLYGTGTIQIANHGTLELAASASGQTIEFASAGLIELAVATGVRITDFSAGDTIDLTALAYQQGDTADYRPEYHALVVQDASHSILATVAVGGLTLAAGSTLAAVDDGNGHVEIVEEPACFLEGTSLLTDRGDVPVEDLVIGDLVATVSGAFRPIRWIGWRRYDPVRIEVGREKVLPIVVTAGALGHNVPARDLLVSPDHALYLEGVLIPARFLVNGCSIFQQVSLKPIAYFHIELDRHNILLAEGAPAESYIESNNRSTFDNAAEYRGWTTAWQDYAPRVSEGPAFAAARVALAARVTALGFTTTLDPDPVLVADGRIVRPADALPGVYRFHVTGPVRTLRLLSRTSVPADWSSSDDTRTLGVNLSRMVMRDRHVTLAVAHWDPSFTEGFHVAEDTHRWTNGDALLPPAFVGCFASDFTIDVHTLAGSLRYPVGRHLHSRARERP